MRRNHSLLADYWRGIFVGGYWQLFNKAIGEDFREFVARSAAILPLPTGNATF